VFWKGGRCVDKSGYVLVRANDHPNASKNGYVREHRLVMEQHLGRLLLKSEVVHHLSSDKSDNRIENLELFSTNGCHLAHELAGRCPEWTEAGKERLVQSNNSRRNPSSPWLDKSYRNARARANYAKRRAAREDPQQ